MQIIIILMFEVLFYSMFLKFARKESNMLKCIITFSLITLIMLLTNTNQFISYLIFLILALYGGKYIIKIKVSLYDMLFIFIMLITKMIIETPLYIILNNIFNNFITTLISSILKILIIYLCRNKINMLYNYLKLKWNNNNFYIRYLFCIFMFIYFIYSIIFLIIKLGI